MQTVRSYIDELVEKYKYRPLPKKVSEEARALYNANLNGFEIKRTTNIQGVPFCTRYNRVVVGDYGAYLEIEEKDLIQALTIPEKQKWRYNEEYVKSKDLSLKYYWLEYEGIKVYHQIAKVKYADYKPNKFYVSVLDFDEVLDKPKINPIFRKLSEYLTRSSVFTHTDVESATVFLDEIVESEQDKINVAVVGDTDISNGRMVSRIFNMLLKDFESQSNVRFLTGELSGAEYLTRKWAKRNRFEVDVYPVIEKPWWAKSSFTDREDRDRRMLARAHVVIILCKADRDCCNFMYRQSVANGRFVTRRIVRNRE